MRGRVWELLNSENGWRSIRFWAPAANWAVVGAAVYDMTQKGPEVISVPMTATLCGYSVLFMRFAWMIAPRNYLLFTCHAFNEAAQLIQLKRGVDYEHERTGKVKLFEQLQTPVALGTAATIFSAIALRKQIRAVVTQPFVPEPARNLFVHPAGPFTIHFWAPIGKWNLSIANLLDINRPVEKISTSQQTSLITTGLLWTRFAVKISPININLLLVNLGLALSAAFHLLRKAKASLEEPAIEAAPEPDSSKK
eukprot:c32479_g1_i1.p1 GENE.c32479_g1_i1~~c32479_g1_i1.p1  ORF type:complete len:263 (+),score=38.21 c32479_g1_i1:35-790(+)